MTSRPTGAVVGATPEAAPQSGGAALVAALAAHGVDTVFGIPGTHNLEIYAALAREGIRHVLPRHEQGAGYAADGYARSSGRVGVVVTTTGPAILNAAAAAAQAYSDSVPVLFCSPGMPLTHPAGGNGLLHEIHDQSGAMAAVLRDSLRVTSVEEIPVAVAQAFALMTADRPRPVHLEIPLDLLEASAPVVPVPVGGSAPRTPLPSALDRAVQLLDRADRVAVIAGGGAQGAASELADVVRRLGAGVVTTANGKGVLAADDPQLVGTGAQHAAARQLVAEADVVLAVGTELAPSDWWSGPPAPTGATIRIDADPVKLAANLPADLPILGDAATTLGLLAGRLAERPPERLATAWVEEQRTAHRAQARAEGAAYLGLVDALAACLPRDAIVAADNAMAVYYGALGSLPLHRSRSFLYPTGAGTLGYGLPAGIGAKVADPDAPVVVLQGDGGLMFSVAELATAAELAIALPVVVVDNGGYGEIRNEMADRDDPVHAVTIRSPDFVALGRSLGCHGVAAATAAEVAEAVAAGLRADRPTVITVPESVLGTTDRGAG